jgi:hypothetical protein
MNIKEKVAAIEKVADKVNGDVVKDYSGRGMYGKICYGIDCDNANYCLEQAGAYGLFGAKVDSMGRGFIVYWEEIEGTAEEEEG